MAKRSLAAKRKHKENEQYWIKDVDEIKKTIQRNRAGNWRAVKFCEGSRRRSFGISQGFIENNTYIRNTLEFKLFL